MVREKVDTDTLIRTLARNPAVKGPGMSAVLGLCLVGMLAYSVLVILATAGARPDFADGASWVAGKAGLSALFALAATPMLLRLARPGQVAGWWITSLVILLALCAVTSTVVLAQTLEPQRLTAFTGGGFPYCTTVIPIVAAPAAAVLFLWLRRQAPTQPMMAGLAAGAVAGALSAMAYALTCPVDSVAFVAAWYPVSIAICAGIGAAAGSIVLRW